MNRRLFAAIALSFGLASGSAQAAFHFFRIQEVYSNADGSVQFIEIFTTSANQQFTEDAQIRLELISPNTVQNTFIFPDDGPAPTNNKTYLIGTSSLIGLGVTPDFILPDNFLQVNLGIANKRINFVTADILNITSLPLDGVRSLNGVVGTDSATVFSINNQATPRNFAGTTITIPEPGALGAFAGGVALLFGLVWSRRRGRSAV